MKKNNGRIPPVRSAMDYAATAMEQMELYCTAHPGSPSAVRRPRVFLRSELWIALLGPSIEEGIVGIGPTIAVALRAFDAQYLAGLRPTVDSACGVGALGRQQVAPARRSYQTVKHGPKSRAEVSDVG
jgi:hypothetical protein